MTILRKAVLATMVCAATLAGCATGPYYDDYGYDRYGSERYGSDRYGYGYGPGYGYDSYYNGPAYVGPSVGLGFTYSDREHRRYRRDRDRDGDGWRPGDRRDPQRAPGYSGG